MSTNGAMKMMASVHLWWLPPQHKCMVNYNSYLYEVTHTCTIVHWTSNSKSGHVPRIKNILLLIDDDGDDDADDGDAHEGDSDDDDDGVDASYGMSKWHQSYWSLPSPPLCLTCRPAANKSITIEAWGRWRLLDARPSPRPTKLSKSSHNRPLKMVGIALIWVQVWYCTY